MIAALSVAAWRQLMSVLGFQTSPQQPKQEIKKPENKIDTKSISLPCTNVNDTTSKSLRGDLLKAIQEHDLLKLKAWIKFVREAIAEKRISPTNGIDLAINICDNDYKNSYESFPLIIAAASDHDSCELINELIKEGSNPTLKDAHKRSALMLAASKGKVNKFIRLLDFAQYDLKNHFEQIVSNIVLGDNPEILRAFVAKVKKLPDGFYQDLFNTTETHSAPKIHKYLLEHHYVSSNPKLIKKLESLLVAR